MTKQTAPGWPDPTDWIKRLDSETRELGNCYLAATAQRHREPASYTEGEVLIEAACTLHAADVLSTIAKSLLELPTFKDHPATTVLNDLVVALHDLAVGGTPALLQRGEKRDEVAPLGSDPVIGFAVLSIRLLRVGHDFSDARARNKVAEIFAKHGFRGRKGRLLTASTLQDWQLAYSTWAADHPVRRAVERLWDEWTSSPDWQQGRDLSQAIRWIELAASKPSLQNKAHLKRL